MLGCMMAIEAVKFLTGFGKPLLLRMRVFNTTDMEFRKLRIRRDDNCRVCGTKGKNEVVLFPGMPEE
jgi:molybdopterin/thiamine biosynthesis adenylyltransferase